MLEKRIDNVTLVVVHVGSQEEWEDSTNPFRYTYFRYNKVFKLIYGSQA